MAAVYCTKGLEKGLAAIVADIIANGCVVKLFKNNYTPVFGSVDANFIEADFPGYAGVGIAASGAPFDVGDSAHWRQTWAEVTFTRSTTGAAQSIFGYYIYNPGVGVYWAERFGATQVVTSAGEQIKFTPYTTDKSEF